MSPMKSNLYTRQFPVQTTRSQHHARIVTQPLVKVEGLLHLLQQLHKLHGPVADDTLVLVQRRLAEAAVPNLATAKVLGGVALADQRASRTGRYAAIPDCNEWSLSKQSSANKSSNVHGPLGNPWAPRTGKMASASQIESSFGPEDQGQSVGS